MYIYINIKNYIYINKMQSDNKNIISNKSFFFNNDYNDKYDVLLENNNENYIHNNKENVNDENEENDKDMELYKNFNIKYKNDIFQIGYSNYIYDFLQIIATIGENYNIKFEIRFDKPKYVNKYVDKYDITKFPLYRDSYINDILIIITKTHIENDEHLINYKNKLIMQLSDYIKQLLYIIIRVLDYDNFYMDNNFDKEKYYYGHRTFNYKNNITIYQHIYKNIINSNIYEYYNEYYNIDYIIDNIINYCDYYDISILEYIKDILSYIYDYVDKLSYYNFNYDEFIEIVDFLDYDIDKIKYYNKYNIYDLYTELINQLIKYISIL